MLCQWGGAQEAGSVQNWDPNLARVVLHITECHAQCINSGELAESLWFLPGAGLGISQWVVSNCIVYHPPSLGIILLFLFSPFSLLLLFYLIFVIKLFLYQSMFPQPTFPFSKFFPHSTMEGREEWECGVISCWAGVNHDSLVRQGLFTWFILGTCALHHVL